MHSSTFTEHGALFKAEMVRALRRKVDPKIKTRRICKPAAAHSLSEVVHIEGSLWGDAEGNVQFRCPYGAVGDRIWVRETWACLDSHKRPGARLAYRADTPDGERVRVDAPWIPAIHMFRWASRITLELTEIRVEPLQEITVADALGEGLTAISKDGGRTTKYGIPDADGLPGTDNTGWAWEHWRQSPVDAYMALWDRISGAGAAALNPPVWAYTFKQVE